MNRTTKMSQYFSHGPFPMKTLPSYSEHARGFFTKDMPTPCCMLVCFYALLL